MSASALGLIVIDAANNVVYANSAAEAIAQAKVADLVIQPGVELPWSLVHRHGGPVFEREMFAPVSPLPSGVIVKVAGAQLDGESRRCSVSVDQLRSFNGQNDHTVLEMQSVASWHEGAAGERLQAASLVSVGQPVIISDPEGRVVFCNPAAGRVFGWGDGEAVGLQLDSFMTPSDRAACEANPGGTIAATASWAGEAVIHRSDGSSFLTLISQTPVFDDLKALAARVTVLNDVADRRVAATNIPTQYSLPGSAREAIFTVGVDGRVQTWSPGAEAVLGYRADDIVGRESLIFCSPKGMAGLGSSSALGAGSETVTDFETIYRHKDGSAIAVSVTSSQITDQEGQPAGATVVAHGTSRLGELTRNLTQQATHDSVTGLPNRRLLNERLGAALSTRGPRGLPVSVLFLSIDQFKTVTFANGHGAADELLVEVAARLADVTRAPDTLACFGSGEFVMLCVDTDDRAAEEVVSQVQESLSAPFELRGEAIYLSATVGTAVTPPLEAHAETLLSQADAARDEARSLGRAHYSASDMSLARQSKERLGLKTDIRDALANDGFEVQYQPVIDLASGRTIGVEAILRWHHTTRGWVPQSVFRPLATKTRLTSELDAWTTQRAIHDAALLRGWGILEPGQKVRIGVCERSIVDPSYLARLRDCLKSGRIPAGVIELELAGPVVVAGDSNAAAALDSLRQLGVSIAVRDFGMGHDPLRRSPHAAIETLVIDRGLIDQLTQSPANLAITTSLIELGRATGLKTVAVGVARFEQLSLLQRLGCTAGQGLLWSPALPRDEYAALARRLPDGFEPADRVSAVSRRGRVRVTNEHGLHRLEQLHREGSSFATIAAALNAEGFQTPQKVRWHGKSVSKVVGDLRLGSSHSASTRNSSGQPVGS